MNFSNFAHAGLALCLQGITTFAAWLFDVSLFEASVMGALLAVGFYAGREVAQAERKAGGYPWYIGFDVRLWSKDAIYDLTCPALACFVVCVVCAFVG